MDNKKRMQLSGAAFFISETTRSLAGRHGRRFEGSALKLPLKGQMSLENPISARRAPRKGGAVSSSGVPRGYLSPRQGCGGSAPTIPQGAR